METFWRKLIFVRILFLRILSVFFKGYHKNTRSDVKTNGTECIPCLLDLLQSYFAVIAKIKTLVMNFIHSNPIPGTKHTVFDVSILILFFSLSSGKLHHIM